MNPDAFNAHLRLNRERFPEYYTIASAEEAEAMDSLSFAIVAISVGVNAPRAGLPASILIEFERTARQAETVFMDARERVRGCHAFRVVEAATRERIESELFKVPFLSA